MNTLRRLIIGMCLFLLAGCSRSSEGFPDLGDGGLVSGEPCSAPCFWNIVPGTTTEEEALSILSNHMEISGCERWDADESGLQEGIACGDVRIAFESELVTALFFTPSIRLTVDDVINKYGDPDGLYVVTWGISMTPPTSMNLSFDHERMTLTLPKQDSWEYTVTEGTEVKSIAYFDDASYALHASGHEEWAGYGVY